VIAQDETVTNAEVISMTKAGLEVRLIVKKIRSSKTKFDLSTDDLIRLKEAGVSGDVVDAMLDTKAVPMAEPLATNTAPLVAVPATVVIPDGTEVKAKTLEIDQRQTLRRGRPVDI